MLKVIFKVEKLVLRCKNISCQILAKKDSNVLHLSHQLALHNGEALIEEQTEFLIIQNDPSFLMQVCLIAGSYKKLGGDVPVNLIEFDEGIYHTTVAALNNSPDRHSYISYTFLYIRKDFLKSQRSLILCSEYGNYELVSMEIEKNQLTKKHHKLQAQIKTLKSKKQSLKNSQKIRNQEIFSKKKDFEEKIKIYQQKIDENKVKNDNLKWRNEEIVKMIQMYGKEEIRTELQNKYPEILDIIQGQEKAQSMKRKIQGSSSQDERIDQKKQLIKKNPLTERKRGQDRSRSRGKQKLCQK